MRYEKKNGGFRSKISENVCTIKNDDKRINYIIKWFRS